MDSCTWTRRLVASVGSPPPLVGMNTPVLMARAAASAAADEAEQLPVSAPLQQVLRAVTAQDNV